MQNKLKRWYKNQLSKLICWFTDCDGMCGYYEICSKCKAYEPNKTYCDIPEDNEV